MHAGTLNPGITNFGRLGPQIFCRRTERAQCVIIQVRKTEIPHRGIELTHVTRATRVPNAVTWATGATHCGNNPSSSKCGATGRFRHLRFMCSFWGRWWLTRKVSCPTSTWFCFSLPLLSRLSLLFSSSSPSPGPDFSWPYLCSCGQLPTIFWLMPCFQSRAPHTILLAILANFLVASPNQVNSASESWSFVSSVFPAPSTYYLCQVSFRLLFPIPSPGSVFMTTH